jgi:O-antigen/teichoic acid export membrane protein
VHRSKRFLSAVGSGYAAVVATSLLAFVSIPIALSYLGREGFGVAATIIQIGAFTQVLQFGVGPSVARFIVDYKNAGDANRTGSFVKMVFFISCAQGLLVVIIAFVGTGWLGAVFDIPAEYLSEFRSVLAFGLLAVAVSFVFNPIQQLLYANQRIDLINYSTIASQACGTAVLAAALMNNCGLISYAIAGWATTATNVVFSCVTASRIHAIPAMGGVKPDWKALPELVRFSGNVMMATIGLQLIAIAPAVVINRLLGAAAMGDWSVGTKLMQLGLQLTGRVSNAAEPTLWEIYAAGEKHSCSDQIALTAQLSTLTAAIIGALLLSLNGNFVKLWSGGLVAWPWQNDFVSACLLIVAAMAGTWCMLPGITKRLGSMRFIYLTEGLLILSLLLVPSLVRSSLAILVGMLASLTACRLAFGIARVIKDLNQSARTVALSIRVPALFWIGMLPVALVVRALLSNNASWISFILGAAMSCIIFIGAAYFLAMPERAKSAVRKLAQRSFSI